MKDACFLSRANKAASGFTPRLQAGVIALLLCALQACATLTSPASAPLDASYKALADPPKGYGRIYVLPPQFDGALGSSELEGRVMVGPEGVGTALAGETSSSRYVAFDAKPGLLFIAWQTTHSNVGTKQTQIMVTDGETIFLRPLTVNLPIPARYGTTPILGSGSSDFQTLPAAQVSAIIHDKQLSSLSDEATAFLQQTPPQASGH